MVSTGQIGTGKVSQVSHVHLTPTVFENEEIEQCLYARRGRALLPVSIHCGLK